MRTLPINQAKDSLSAVVHAVEAGEPVELTRHGRPAAVMISFEAYTELVGEADGFGMRLDRFAERWRAVSNASEEGLNDPFADVRDRGLGRIVEL